MTTAQTQKALFLVEKKGHFKMGTRPIPKPGKDEVLVEIKSAALNPADLWIQKFGILYEEYPAVLGFDCSGIVARVGGGVTRFKVGDRVFFGAEFKNDYSGFQEYAIANVHTAALIPANLSYDDGATLPISLSTAYLGLYNQYPKGLGLDSFLNPGGKGAYAGQAIFVSAGSGSVGQVVLQLAKLSGFSFIVTTASPHNASLLKSLGATHVLDRSLPLPSILDELEKIEGLPKFEYAYDAYGEANSSLLQAMTVLAPGGKCVTVAPRVVFEPTDGKTLAKFSAEKNVPENVPHLRAFLESGEATKLLESGEVKPQKTDVLPGGLSGVVDGLKRIENGQVSAVKLVVHIEETP